MHLSKLGLVWTIISTRYNHITLKIIYQRLVHLSKLGLVSDRQSTGDIYPKNPWKLHLPGGHVYKNSQNNLWLNLNNFNKIPTTLIQSLLAKEPVESASVSASALKQLGLVKQRHSTHFIFKILWRMPLNLPVYLSKLGLVPQSHPTQPILYINLLILE